MRSNRKYALLTGTIDPSVYSNVDSVITDADERLEQYKTSLYRYIMESAFTDIVFAENSGYPFDTEYYEDLARKHGKRFEYLSCPRYIKETTEYGKSYGEARLITDGLEKSRLLEETSTVYKVTGRVFLQNSRAVVRTMKKHKNEFLVTDKFKMCYTHVFKIDRQDYEEFFRDAYKRIMSSRVNIERNYYALIVENYDRLDIGCFSVWPHVLGTSATTGGTYTSSIKGRMFHDILCRCGAYTHGSRFGDKVRM